jgi:DNA-binding PadR family transcriptional regulator
MSTPAATDKPLNATAASLLGFLLEGPRSGWDLVATAEQRIGNFWSLTRSQVYRELGALAERGLITAGMVGARDRQPYELTAAGRAAFQAWLAAQPGPEQIRYPLLLKLSFGRHLAPEQRAAFISAHRDAHSAKLAAYNKRLPELRAQDPYAAAVLTFGINYETAVLRWLDQLPDLLPGGSSTQAVARASGA